MQVRTVLLWEGAANALMAVVKLLVGIHTGSTAILGDALHSLSDLANNGIALITLRFASQPPDHDHPYGHQKFEQLAVFTLAGLLTVVAFELLMTAIQKFDHRPEQSILGLSVMLVTLLINIALASWERYWAKRLKSDILHADAQHTFSDIFTTVAVIAGWQLAAIGYQWLDAVFAIIVAILVLYLAFDLFRRAIPILVDGVASDPEQLINAIKEIREVITVKRVRSRHYGPHIAADVVVTVDGSLTTKQAHAVADSIESLLELRFGIQDTTVHIEPHSAI